MFIRYALGQQTSIFIRSIQEIVLRTLFAPSELALLNLIQIISSTFTMFQSYIIAASLRLITPIVMRTDSSKKLLGIRSNALYLELFQQAIFAFLIILLGPIFWSDKEQHKIPIFLFALLTMTFTAIQALMISFLETSNNFRTLGSMLPFGALIQALIILIGAYQFGIIGLIISYIVALVVNILIIYLFLARLRINLISRPKLDVTRSIGESAVKFRIADLPTSFLYSLDLILASIILSNSALAIYVTGKLFVNLTSQLVNAKSTMAKVSLGIELGKPKNQQEISLFLTKNMIIIYLILLPFSIAIADPFARYLTPIIIPKYTESLIVLPYLLLAEFSSGRNSFMRNYWVVLGSWNRIFFSGFFGLIFLSVTYTIGYFYFKNIGIIELAILTLIGQIPFIYIIIYLTGKDLKNFRRAIYQMLIFVTSLVLSYFCLKLNGSFDGIKITTINELIVSLIKGFSPIILSFILGLIILGVNKRIVSN